ncbi:MAG TPA: galactitol-1-phosphate 5-dehydrogenase [Clostridiales bacterium]|nr:galactitol-1-phosphate 5-dehydrogenase [Clostridiales bacterium]
MKALVYQGPFHLEIEERKKPVPKPGEVLIEVKACGICGSDIHGYAGKTGRRTPPVIMGHEFSGILSGIGSEVQDLIKGQRVTVQPLLSCGECADCRSGRRAQCAYKSCLGAMSRDGAMTEYLCVDQHHVRILPEEVSFAQAAVVEPLAVAYRAVNSQEVKGKTVFVAGVGTIGLLTVMMLAARGARQIIVSDRSEYRLNLASRLGAGMTLNAAHDDFSRQIASLSEGKGIDLSFEAVGIGPTVSQALDCLKKGGHCVWIGNSAKMIELNMQQVVTRELSISGTYGYSDDDFSQALTMISSGKIAASSIVDRQVSLEEAPAVFDSLARGADQPVKCLIVF